MRRSLLIAALLSGTAIVTPSSAKALPVWGFLQGVVFSTTGFALGGTTVAGFVQGAKFAGTFFGGLVVRSVVSLGLGALLNALNPNGNQPPPSAQMVNYAQPINYAAWIVGKARHGGFLGFTGFKNSTDTVTGQAGAKRHYSIVLAAHPSDGIETFFIDEREAEIDANGKVTTAPMTDHYRLRPFLGNDPADPELLNAFPELTPQHDFAGLTGVHAWAARPDQSRFSEIYPRGREGAITPVVRGALCFDPRDGQTRWTDNAALIIAFWLTEIHGRPVDWDAVAIEADVSDMATPRKAGGDRPRWRLGGIIRSESSFEQQRAALAVACDAFFFERADGKVGFYVGRWIAPEVTLTHADFLTCEVKQGDWGGDAPTEVAIQYTEPDARWREFPSGSFQIADEGRQNRDTPEVFFCQDHDQAYFLNVRIGKARRPEWVLRGTVGLIGRRLATSRFVAIDHPILGNAVQFEIDKLTRGEGGLTWDIEARSVVPADFDPDVADTPDRPPIRDVASDDTIPDVANLNAVAINGGAVRFTWDTPDSGLRVQVFFREQGAAAWSEMIAPEGDTSVTSYGHRDGATLEFQARNRTASLRSGDLVPDPPATVLVVGNTEPPASVSGLGVTASVPDVEVSWTAPDDPSYAGAKVMRADYATGYSGAYDIGSAAEVGVVYGPRNTGHSFTDPAPAVGHYAYWAISINGSDVEGTATGPVTIEI